MQIVHLPRLATLHRPSGQSSHFVVLLLKQRLTELTALIVINTYMYHSAYINKYIFKKNPHYK